MLETLALLALLAFIGIFSGVHGWIQIGTRGCRVKMVMLNKVRNFKIINQSLRYAKVFI